MQMGKCFVRCGGVRPSFPRPRRRTGGRLSVCPCVRVFGRLSVFLPQVVLDPCEGLASLPFLPEYIEDVKADRQTAIISPGVCGEMHALV